MTSANGPVSLLQDNRDKYGRWRTYTVERAKFRIDVFGNGGDSVIVRIALDFPRSADFATAAGLKIAAGSYGNLMEVERAYGPVKETFAENSLETGKAILAGTPYRQVSPNGKVEFRHYPARGVGFLINDGNVYRCFISRPNERPVWGF